VNRIVTRPVITELLSALALALSLPASGVAESAPDRVNRAWQLLPAMPTPRSEIACATISNKIFVVGGISLSGSKRAFEAFDPGLSRWEKLAPLPSKLNHSGVAAWGDTVYVSGGFVDLRQKRFSDKIFAYDTGENRWREIGRMPGFRNKHYMIARDGWLHLFGGLETRETWSCHLATGRWFTDRIAPIPAQRDHITVLQDDKHLYIVGGREGRRPRADCWRYDFERSRWKTFAELPRPRSAPTAVLHHGRIHVVGGEDVDTKEVYRRHDVFDLASGKWSSGPPLPRPRHGMASCLLGDRWIVIGGGRKAEVGTVFSATRSVEEFVLE